MSNSTSYRTIKYIYAGELELENLSGEDTLGLLIASDELLFEEIFKLVQDHLILKQTSWTLEKIEEYHYKKSFKTTILPTRVANLESSIIRPKLATIISNWIEKNDSNIFSSNNKYRFDLIYSNTRDGFDCQTFNTKCNGQGPFVVLIKVQSKEIFGGYNSIGYELRNGKWLCSSDNFIFSFENDQDSRNMKLGRVIHANRSHYEHCDEYFINFGDSLYIEERQKLYLRKNGNYINIRNNVSCTMPIEEIEAFSVEMK
ncbi:9168_t:CDS:2 [Funneliformis geosporum]|nr:9168_t:CDS:2 [Funneliformis geosporum]